MSRRVRVPLLGFGRAARATLADHSGAAAVEFAIMAPVLLLLLLGVIDYAGYISARMELEQALRAGGQYALKDYTDSTTIEAAVSGATDITVTDITVGGLACECPDGTSTYCRGDANYTTCAGGEAPGGFVTITGSTTYAPIFAGLPGLSASMDIDQALTMRVK